MQEHTSPITHVLPRSGAVCKVKSPRVNWSVRYTAAAATAALNDVPLGARVAKLTFPRPVFGPPPQGSSDGGCEARGRAAAREIQDLGRRANRARSRGNNLW